MIIFDKYEITVDGIKNVKTGKFLKVEETSKGKFAKITVDGKTKRINLNDYQDQLDDCKIDEAINEFTDFDQIEDSKIEQEIEVSQNEQPQIENSIVEQEVEDSKIEQENQPQPEGSQVEQKQPRRKSSRKYKIVVTEMDGTQLSFNTYKAANDHYGLRKDYLNYCITDKHIKMLIKANLKKVEKIYL